jgi:hypothetical protein
VLPEAGKNNGKTYDNRLRRAAWAPFLPNAVRTDLGKCAIVRFFLAALAAFLMFLREALLCFDEAIFASS